MKLTRDLLRTLDDRFGRYLEGDAVDELFSTFGIQFAAGHWCAGEFFDRFCVAGYNGKEFDASIEAQMRRIRAAGIDGVEFHNTVFLDDAYQRDGAKVASVKAGLQENRLTPTCMNM